MLYAEVSTQDRDKLLEELKHTTDAKWYRRLKLIHLSSQKTSVPKLAKLFDLCPATVRDYIKRYQTGGVEGLRRQNSGGAPEHISLTKADWEDLLHQRPSQYGRLETGARNWTQALLVLYLQRYHGVTVTQPAISECLKRYKIHWNRGKLKVTSPDPLYTVKRERVEALKKSRDADHDEP